MRVNAPGPGIDFETSDIYGEPVRLSDYLGRGVLLAFFRDAACPFCHFRLYELSRKYKTWNRAGLEIIAVFTSPPEEVRKHLSRHPRPYRVISDARLRLYNLYGVEQDPAGTVKALLFQLPRVYRGIVTGGRPHRNPHRKIIPANFILDADGRLVETWYGRDAADHIPLHRIQSFVDELSWQSRQKTEKELEALQTKNRKLKKALVRLNKQYKSMSDQSASKDSGNNQVSDADALVAKQQSH